MTEALSSFIHPGWLEGEMGREGHELKVFIGQG